MENSINIFKNKLNEHNKDIDYKNVITPLQNTWLQKFDLAVKFHSALIQLNAGFKES